MPGEKARAAPSCGALSSSHSLPVFLSKLNAFEKNDGRFAIPKTNRIPREKRPFLSLGAFNGCGLDSTPAMAGDDRDAAFGVAGRGAIENETPMGLLDFPAEQRALGCVGLEGARLRLDHSSVRPRSAQHPRRRQERACVN